MLKVEIIRHRATFVIRLMNRCKIYTTRNTFSNTPGVKTTTEKCGSKPQIRRIIKDAGFPISEGYATFQTKCPICPPTSSKKTNIVHINKTTGFFVCPSCQKSATWNDVQVFFDSGNENKSSSHFISICEKFLEQNPRKSPYRPEHQNKDFVTITQQHRHLLEGSWVSPYIVPLSQLGAKLHIESGEFYIPLRNYDKVVGEKVCKVNALNFENTLPREKCNGLVKLNLSSKDSKKAILVLTIRDLLIIGVNKIDQASVICLPYGLKLLSQEILPELESFQELIFWFDFDAAGWDSALNFAKKLGERRCLFVRPVRERQTPYTALMSGTSLKSVLRAAQPVIHDSITTFEYLKEDIYSELQNIEKVNGVKWTRYMSLNKILKGHRKGELTILTGPTGSGKTTFMSEYSLDLAMQGVTTLWGSFEIRNIRLASTLLRQFVGYPLNDKLEEFEEWCGKMEKLPIYFTTFHGQQNLKVVMDAIDHAQYVYDIHHFIIDNVQFMLGTGTGLKFNDKFWEQDAIVSAFRKFATTKNVHVTLVMHPRKERENEELTTSSIFGSAKASQEADNVLIIQDKRLNSLKGRKILQVVKNRYSGDLGIMPLNFNKEALSFAEKKK